MKPIQRIIDDYCEEHGVSKIFIKRGCRRKSRFSKARRAIIQLALQEGHNQSEIAFELKLCRQAVNYHVHS